MPPIPSDTDCLLSRVVFGMTGAAVRGTEASGKECERGEREGGCRMGTVNVDSLTVRTLWDHWHLSANQLLESNSSRRLQGPQRHNWEGRALMDRWRAIQHKLREFLDSVSHSSGLLQKSLVGENVFYRNDKLFIRTGDQLLSEQVWVECGDAAIYAKCSDNLAYVGITALLVREFGDTWGVSLSASAVATQRENDTVSIRKIVCNEIVHNLSHATQHGSQQRQRNYLGT